MACNSRAQSNHFAGNLMAQHQWIGQASAMRTLPDQDIATAYAAGAHANQNLTRLRRRRRIDIAMNLGTEPQSFDLLDGECLKIPTLLLFSAR